MFLRHPWQLNQKGQWERWRVRWFVVRFHEISCESVRRRQRVPIRLELPSRYQSHRYSWRGDRRGQRVFPGISRSGQRTCRVFDCAVISVQKEKASYSAVKRSLYAEILYTTGDDDSGNILCDDSCKCCTADANVYNFKISTNLKAKKNDIWLICFCTQCYTSNRKK